MIRFWHRCRYDLRETREDGRYFVCRCGRSVRQLERDEPVIVHKPAFETLKARRLKPADVLTLRRAK